MYKIYFVDGSHFIGGEYYDSLWNQIPSKPIARLEYRFNGKCLYAEGYEEYNHIVEHAKVVSTGQQFITKVVVMLKNGSDVLQVNYNPASSQVAYSIGKYGEEFRGKPTTGWKQGMFTNPQCRLE